MQSKRSYIRDGASIYRKSFSIIRDEADLSRFNGHAEKIAVRMIHASGMVEIARDIVMSEDFVANGREALLRGAPILCDANMVAYGVTRSRLPAANDVICTLDDASVPDLARSLQTTRSAAAVELWKPRLGGSIVVIGNAPTALFRLLEILDDGASPPAAIIGIPVGFVGAIESKEALVAYGRCAYLTVAGRKGGSAMAAAAINALASEAE